VTQARLALEPVRVDPLASVCLSVEALLLAWGYGEAALAAWARGEADRAAEAARDAWRCAGGWRDGRWRGHTQVKE